MKNVYKWIAISSFTSLVLAGCGTLDDDSESSGGAADQSVAVAFAPDDPRGIRARAGGTDIGLTQRSTAADGTVVFHAEAPLLPEDQNVHEDIYLKTPDGELTRITRAYTGAETNNASLYPCISDDGNIVAFCSRADNLVPGDVNGDWDVFVYNRTTEQLSLVSVDNSGVQGERGSLLPSLSADGTRVTFVSRATLTPEKASTSRQDIFLRNLSTGTTTLVSHDGGGGSGNSHSYDPVLSGDGTCVAYASRSTNLVTGDTNGRQDIFCYDATTGITTRITDGNSHSYWPSLSTDGSLVGFTSYASNLVAGDNNARRDIFTWDGAEFKAVTHGDNHAGRCVVNGDGTRIAFDSLAENLVADGNGQNDIFLTTIPGSIGSMERLTEGAPSGDPPSMTWEGTFISVSSSSEQIELLSRGLRSFENVIEISLGSQPYAVALGDLDEDGNLDMVAVNYGSDKASIRLNVQSGAYSGDEVDVGNAPISVALGDVNGDGDLDLVTANNSSGNVSVRLNDGSGAFSGGSEVGAGSQARAVTLGDLNGDGDLDMVVANFGANNAVIRHNDGNGNFSGSTQLGLGHQPISAALGDLDADGDLDLVAANNGSHDLSIRFNNGDGTFSSSIQIGVGPNPRSVVLGDVDGDGDLDIATANYGSDSVTVCLNDGSGDFDSTPHIEIGVGNQPYAVTVGDVEGDGDLDLITANYGASTASVRLNDGNGIFRDTAPAEVGVGLNPIFVVLGDIDGDGFVDLVTANYSSNGASVVTNTAYP